MSQPSLTIKAFLQQAEDGLALLRTKATPRKKAMAEADRSDIREEKQPSDVKCQGSASVQVSRLLRESGQELQARTMLALDRRLRGFDARFKALEKAIASAAELAAESSRTPWQHQPLSFLHGDMSARGLECEEYCLESVLFEEIAGHPESEFLYAGQGLGSYEKVTQLRRVGQGHGSWQKEVLTDVSRSRCSWWRISLILTILIFGLLVIGAYFLFPWHAVGEADDPDATSDECRSFFGRWADIDAATYLKHGKREGHAATVVMTVASSFAPTETLIYLRKESICERLTAALRRSGAKVIGPVQRRRSAASKRTSVAKCGSGGTIKVLVRGSTIATTTPKIGTTAGPQRKNPGVVKTWDAAVCCTVVRARSRTGASQNESGVAGMFTRVALWSLEMPRMYRAVLFAYWMAKNILALLVSSGQLNMFSTPTARKHINTFSRNARPAKVANFRMHVKHEPV
eukprot:symbB.v1.2.028939.t5/scaffold3119.1/size63149/2